MLPDTGQPLRALGQGALQWSPALEPAAEAAVEAVTPQTSPEPAEAAVEAKEALVP